MAQGEVHEDRTPDEQAKKFRAGEIRAQTLAPSRKSPKLRRTLPQNPAAVELDHQLLTQKKTDYIPNPKP